MPKTSNNTTLTQWLQMCFDCRPLLDCWGVWQSIGTEHLGYKTSWIAINNRNRTATVFLTEDELMLIDKALTKISKQDFETIKLKFIQRMSDKQMMQYFGLKSHSRITAKLAGAVKAFDVAIRFVLSEQQAAAAVQKGNRLV